MSPENQNDTQRGDTRESRRITEKTEIKGQRKRKYHHSSLPIFKLATRRHLQRNWQIDHNLEVSKYPLTTKEQPIPNHQQDNRRPDARLLKYMWIYIYIDLKALTSPNTIQPPPARYSTQRRQRCRYLSTVSQEQVWPTHPLYTPKPHSQFIWSDHAPCRVEP